MMFATEQILVSWLLSAALDFRDRGFFQAHFSEIEELVLLDGCDVSGLL